MAELVMVNYETLIQHLKWEGATHLVSNPDGSLIAYRKSIAFPKHWSYLPVAKLGNEYHTGSSWLLTETPHVDMKEIK